MPHTVLTASSPLNCLTVATAQFWARNGVGQCWTQAGYCAFSRLCWMDETWHSQLGHWHEAPARPWHCHAAQLRSAGSRWQLQGEHSAPCPAFGGKNHQRIYAASLYTLSSSHGDICTAPHGKNVEGRLVSPRFVRSCHQKATFQNEKKWVTQPQRAQCPSEAGRFEVACSGKGIGFYFACDALFWYSQSRFKNAHQK